MTGARLNQDDYLFAIKNWKNIFLLLLGGVLNVRRCPRNSCPELSFGVFFPNYLSSSLTQYVGCLVLVAGARFGNTNKLVRFVDTFFGLKDVLFAKRLQRVYTYLATINTIKINNLAAKVPLKLSNISQR